MLNNLFYKSLATISTIGIVVIAAISLKSSESVNNQANDDLLSKSNLTSNTSGNASAYEEARLLCARFYANQISYKEVAELLQLKEPITLKEGGWRSGTVFGGKLDISNAAKEYCKYLRTLGT